MNCKHIEYVILVQGQAQRCPLTQISCTCALILNSTHLKLHSRHIEDLILVQGQAILTLLHRCLYLYTHVHFSEHTVQEHLALILNSAHLKLHSRHIEDLILVQGQAILTLLHRWLYLYTHVHFSEHTVQEHLALILNSAHLKLHSRHIEDVILVQGQAILTLLHRCLYLYTHVHFSEHTVQEHLALILNSAHLKLHSRHIEDVILVQGQAILTLLHRCLYLYTHVHFSEHTVQEHLALILNSAHLKLHSRHIEDIILVQGQAILTLLHRCLYLYTHVHLSEHTVQGHVCPHSKQCLPQQAP